MDFDFLDLLRGDGIQPVKVASSKGGEFASPCPGCGGEDRFHSWPKEGKDGRWFCRGCQKSGDAIAYLREFRGMTFHQACEALGRDPGKKHAEESRRERPESKQQKKTRDYAGEFLNDLKNTPTQAALDYLEGRKLTSLLDELRAKKLIAFKPESSKSPASIVYPVTTLKQEVIGLQYVPLDGGEKKFAGGNIPGTYKDRGFFCIYRGKAETIITEAVADACSVAVAMPSVNVICVFSSNFTEKLKLLEDTLQSVILFFDRDQAGEKASRRATGILDGKCLVVDWNLAPEGCKDPNDLLKAGHLEVIRNMVKTAKQAEPLTEADRELPEINAKNLDLPGVASQSWAALLAANDPPKYFNHPLGLVRLEDDPEKGLFPQELTENRLRHELARVATWIKWEGKESKVPALPPMHVVQDMLAAPQPPLPYLTRIVEYPIFAPDNTLHLTPGYQKLTRCFYAKNENLHIPEVPSRPTRGDIERARDLLEDLICDFPFVEEPGEPDAEKAHACALYVLPHCRDLIHGPTPLHVSEATTPGSGKTLLVQALTFPALGRVLPSITEPRDPAEWTKKITSALRIGPSFVFIDNIRRRVDSGDLASVLTSSVWSDRILGRSEIIYLPIKNIWVATGNNLLMSSEIARRTIRIRLDAKQEQPWLRDPSQFRHKNLLQWAGKRRGELIGAALTLIQAWIAEECPEPAGVKPLGMFESWSHVIGGILEVAGIKGFLGNLQAFYSESDFEGSILRTFIEAWWEKFRQGDVGVSDLFNLVVDCDIPLNLGKGGDRSQKIRLGIILKQNRDRQFSNYRIIAGKVSHQAQLWHLAPAHLEAVSVGVKPMSPPPRIRCVNCLDYQPGEQPNFMGRCRGAHPYDGDRIQAPQIVHECDAFKAREN